MARDLERYGIRVVTIAPGAFTTSMTSGMNKKAQESISRDLLFPRRMGEPREFAQTVKWIVECPYVNGETIRLSGGSRLPGSCDKLLYCSPHSNLGSCNVDPHDDRIQLSPAPYYAGASEQRDHPLARIAPITDAYKISVQYSALSVYTKQISSISQPRYRSSLAWLGGTAKKVRDAGLDCRVHPRCFPSDVTNDFQAA
jgi:hypothetical protein